jgi:hypothetical protein
MKTLNDMVHSLERLFPSGPSWPWRTQSAISLWKAVEKAVEDNPKLRAAEAIREGYLKTGIPSVELTPEDMNMLALATRWKLSVVQRKEQSPKDGVIPMRQTPKRKGLV